MSGENGCMTTPQLRTNKRVFFFDQIKAIMIADLLRCFQRNKNRFGY